MALIDKASLLMVPSTYEDGTLYNILPSGNKAPDETGSHNGYDQTRADFTFSRGSNLAATRVNSDGLIEKGRENLFTQSNNFSHSDWNVKQGTFTQGEADPDGGNNAWAWEATNTDPYLYQSGKSKSGVSVLSIWVKGVGSTIGKYFEFRIGGTPYYNFVLTGEWQRLEYYVNHSSGGSSVGWEYGNPAVVGDVVHIYQAQYEVGTIATAYMDSGSTTAQAGILEDMPRINYDANGENGALLLESSRTNLIENSEYINGESNVTKIGASIETNKTTSPEGVKNASYLKENSSNSSHFAFKDFALTSGTTYTISIFAKSNGVNRNLRIGDGGVGWSADFDSNFDLTAGTATNNGVIEDYGNGWYRCSVTGTANAASSRLILYATLVAATSYQGDGTSGVYLYGWQIEAASHVSSYIPTHGAAVTRGADSCSVTGVSDVIGSTTGSGYVEFTTYNHEDFGGIFEIINASTPAQRLVIWMTSTDNQIQLHTGSIGGGDISKNNLSVGNHKAVFTYTTSKIKFFVDGEKVGEKTPTSLTGGFNKVDFYHSQGAVFLQKKDISQAVLFDEELTEAEAIALTTL